MVKKSYWTTDIRGHQIVIVNDNKNEIETKIIWDDKMRLFRINVRLRNGNKTN